MDVTAREFLTKGARKNASINRNTEKTQEREKTQTKGNNPEATTTFLLWFY